MWQLQIRQGNKIVYRGYFRYKDECMIVAQEAFEALKHEISEYFIVRMRFLERNLKFEEEYGYDEPHYKFQPRPRRKRYNRPDPKKVFTSLY